jgi:hypothetical protein
MLSKKTVGAPSRMISAHAATATASTSGAVVVGWTSGLAVVPSLGPPAHGTVRDLAAAASERARVAGPVGRDAGAQPGPRGRGAPAEGTRLLALSLLASASSLPVKSTERAHPATPARRRRSPVASDSN